MARETVKGLRELERKLRKLPDKLAGQALNFALRKAAKPVQDEAMRLVPRKSGVLQRSIVIRKQRSSNPRNHAQMNVGVRKNAKSGGDPYYWRFVEFGFTKRDGSFYPARPFLRPALERTHREATRIFADELEKRIHREARKKA